VIDLAGVSASLGGVSVLEGVDLGVERGEFVGLIGPNGAGKTTLLRTINGVVDPEAGSVLIDGDPARTLSARERSRRVATVPQDTHVGFAFTVEQIVEMGRTPHRSRLDWGEADEPVDRALSRTDTEALRDRQVGELSGGERQRVLLARALAQQPDALLLDEPTASLDINHQIRVLELAAGLVDDGRAALAAIHDLDLAARFCDRLALLHEGRIAARGPPAAVLHDDRLDGAFETSTAVTSNPVTGAPQVAAFDDRPSRDTRVHVVGGGEPGAAVVRTLWQAGYEVSVGIVPGGDVTARLAARLDVDAVTVDPFAEPAPAARDASRRQARAADVVVVTDGVHDTAAGQTASAETIHAALTGTGAAARGDGGERVVAETAAELLAAVDASR